MRYFTDGGASGGAVGWGTGRSRVRFPTGSMGYLFPLILPAALWPWIDSASNGNEYQEYLLGGKGGRCVRLTTLPPSCADCQESLGASTSWSPKDLWRPVMWWLYLYLCLTCEDLSAWFPPDWFVFPWLCFMTFRWLYISCTNKQDRNIYALSDIDVHTSLTSVFICCRQLQYMLHCWKVNRILCNTQHSQILAAVVSRLLIHYVRKNVCRQNW
jgi:hypothetical protein